MSMLLAVLLQATPALPADPLQAALICRDATVVGQMPLSLETEVQALYFSTQAARALPGNADYFQRMTTVVDSPPPEFDRAQAPQLRTACDQRYPLARRPGPVTLPATAWERDLVCVTAAMSLQASSEGRPAVAGGVAPFDRAHALARRYQQRIDAGMAAHGVGDADIGRLIGAGSFAALELGNVLAIAAACEREGAGA